MSDLLALFDVDGTLVDSEAIIVATMARAFALSDLPAPDAGQVRVLIGLSLPLMIGRLMQGQPDAVQARVNADYRLGFVAAMEEGEAPDLYPGVAEGLSRLAAAGVTLGLATGKSKRGLDRLIAAEGLEGVFATQQCADFHPSKPHPSMIRTAMHETHIGPERTLMIGDSIYDMEMACAAQVTAIGVGWGYHPPDALAASGATVVAPDFGALVELILEKAT